MGKNGRADRQTDITKLMFAFEYFAKVTKRDSPCRSQAVARSAY